MGGSNRRRQQRPSASRGAAPTPSSGAPKPAWRETFNAWGGYPIFITLVVALIFVAGLIYMNRPGVTAGSAAYQPTTRAQVNGRTAGNPDASVKLIEFADFQCPFCKRFADDGGKKLLEEFVNKGTVSLQFVSFAFLGEESRRAAEAAECAADQGRFWDYHDLLYLRQGAENSKVFSAGNLKRFAAELKTHFSDFDTGKFVRCLDDGAKRATVEQQTKQASDAGVKSTPSFLINGVPMSGVQPIETLRQAIEAAQKAAAK
ncbi:MAG: hypothetical protein EXR68_03745 [Dehalococcoidia bacterium]|nr:hypothetical protein [Dehalococcoidia bacterium]